MTLQSMIKKMVSWKKACLNQVMKALDHSASKANEHYNIDWKINIKTIKGLDRKVSHRNSSSQSFYVSLKLD